MPSRAASFSLDSLPALLATIFDQSQKSASTHRKNIALLFKLFTTCSAITEPLPGDRGLLLTGEKAFVTALKEGGINRILPVKKGQTNADRIVKLVCAFISHAGEQEAARQTADGEAEDATPISRLTSSLLKHLLKGFTAKDKNVRFRSTQFVATLMSGLGELDNTDYQALLSALLLRIRDKEGAIRVQAVLALSKLQNPDELVHLPEIGEDGVPTAEGDLSFDDLILAGADSDMENPTKVLIDIMRHDPSAEVRRAALFQLQLVPQTLPYVLSRARDADPINRRLLYASCLAELPNMGVLTPSQRVLIVKYGCADREESVKKAATALLGKWAALGSGREGGEQIDGQEAVHEFVSLFDVVGEVKTAELAIQAIFESRQDLALQLQFPDAYWNELTPESALIARLYIAHCKATNDEIRLEASLPVITAFAFKIQAVHNTLLELHGQILASTEDDGLLQAEDRDALLRNSENVTFVIDQLLQVALLADYGDEIGRRKMFTLVRDMISDPNLPSSLISGCMDVLHKLSSHERDFQRVIVEIVQNVREDANAANETPDPEAMTEDDEEDDEAELLDLENATAEEIAADQRRRLEKAAKKMQNQTLDLEKKETYIRCLELVRALLERVDGVLSDNATLMGLVHDLIVPSVKSKEPEIRENGLLCLGLCCLLDKSYALDSFGLFVHQSQETNGELQIKIFKIIFDILMLYGVSFLTEKFEDHDAKRVLEFLLHALNQDSMEIQAVAAIGIAKLMLSGMVADNEVLKRLVLVYFAPETIDNLELRQCLSYFFPVYCYSQSANQKRMQEIFLSCLEILSVVHEDLDDPSMMVSPVQLANQLLDWTDPQKAVAPEGVKVDETIQVDLTIDILKQIYKEPKKETRKQLCQLLGKLHIPDSLDEWQCKNVLLLISQLDSHRPLKDTVSRNALTRFENGLKKRFPAPVPLNEDEFRELDQLLGVVTFLDAIRAENDERESGDEFEQPDAGAKKKPAAATRKRKISRSPSVASTAGSVAAAPRGRSVSATVEPDTSIIRRSARAPKPAAKKQPVIVEEDESESDSSSESESASDAESESAEDDEAETSKESLPKKVAPPAKAKPKAKAASKAASRPVSKTASTSSTGSKASATQDASDDTDDTM